MWPYVVAASVFAVDQLTKWAVIRFMEMGESIPIWEGVFHLTSHRNRGAAFGILQGQRWLFVLITVVVVIGVIAYLNRTRNRRPLVATALALLLGGASGIWWTASGSAKWSISSTRASSTFRFSTWPIRPLSSPSRCCCGTCGERAATQPGEAARLFSFRTLGTSKES